MSNGNNTRRCVVCGGEYQQVRPWQKYDKPACGVIARNRRRYDKIREAVKLLDRYKAKGTVGVGGRG